MPHHTGPDYSDCARSVRESATLLDRIARRNIVKRDELLSIVSYLLNTALSLENDESVVLLGDYRGETTAHTTHSRSIVESDRDDVVLDH